MITLGILLLHGFVLSACGFHLRGSAVLPRGMNVTYVQETPSSSAIGLPLRRSLANSGARVTLDESEAGATVRILSEVFDRRLLATGSAAKAGGGTSIVKDYELIYRVTFSAQSKESGWAAPEQTISVTRELSFDEAQVLAKTAEQDQLQRAMVQDAVRQMLTRLQLKAR